MNLSQPYHNLLNQSEPPLSATDIQTLSSQYRIILLKGFLGDLLPKRFDSYFFDQMRWMREHNIEFWRLESDSGYGTQKLSQNNAEAIEKAIRVFHEKVPNKGVLVVSHSKGGMDTLETLISRTSLSRREIAGWIALQAPFWGTPVADWATSSNWFNPLVEQLLEKWFKGDRKVAASMGLANRQDYMRQHAKEIFEIAEKFDILCFVSSSASGDASLFKPLRFAIDKIAKVPNDGLLPTRSGMLEVEGRLCCPYVETEHLDHIYAVMPLMPDRPAGGPFEHKALRIRIYSALLKIWLDQRKHA